MPRLSIARLPSRASRLNRSWLDPLVPKLRKRSNRCFQSPDPNEWCLGGKQIRDSKLQSRGLNLDKDIHRRFDLRRLFGVQPSFRFVDQWL